MDIQILENGDVISKTIINGNSEYQAYHDIFYMHDAITPLDNPFIQHMLFDPYIKEEHGNYPKIVANAFNQLIDLFLKKKKNIINDTKTKIEDVKHLQDLLSKSILLDISGDDKNIKTKIIDELNLTKDVLILAGWSGKKGGHAIVIRVILKANNLYDAYIFNSGEGVENHIIDETKERYIGIKIKDTNMNQIEELLDLIRFCKINYDEIKKYRDHIQKLNEEYNIKLIDLDIQKNINFIKNFYIKKKAIQDKSNTGKEYYRIKKIDSLFKNGEEDYFKYLKENEDKIKINFEEILKFLKKFSLKNSYIPNEDDSLSYYFYQTFFKIFKSNKKIPIFKDVLQMSGSCSFFSLFYCIKYYLLQKGYIDFFDNFYEFIKKNTILYLIQILIDTRKGKEIKQIENDELKIFLNSFYLILKDNIFSSDIKNLIIDSLNDIFSKRLNTGLSIYIEKNIEEKDEKKKDFFNFYKEIIEKYNFFIDETDINIEIQYPEDIKKNGSDLYLIIDLDEIFFYKNLGISPNINTIQNNENDKTLFKCYLLNIFELIIKMINMGKKFIIMNNKKLYKDLSFIDYYNQYSYSIYFLDYEKYLEIDKFENKYFNFLFLYILLKADNKKDDYD